MAHKRALSEDQNGIKLTKLLPGAGIASSWLFIGEVNSANHHASGTVNRELGLSAGSVMLLKCLSQLPPLIHIRNRVRELPIGQMRTRKYVGRIFAQLHKWHNEDALSDNAFDRSSTISKQQVYNSTFGK